MGGERKTDLKEIKWEYQLNEHSVEQILKIASVEALLKTLRLVKEALGTQREKEGQPVGLRSEETPRQNEGLQEGPLVEGNVGSMAKLLQGTVLQSSLTKGLGIREEGTGRQGGQRVHG